MQDAHLKQLQTYGHIARKAVVDPDNTLFVALDPKELALFALGMTLIRAMYPDLREEAITLHEKLHELSEVQKEEWRRGRRST
jgi:hypothetical protein